MATDYEGLLPVGVAREVIESAGRQSVVLRLARTIPMPEGVTSIPVVSVVPQADWVALGARKPLTKIEWSSARLEAQEVAATAAIPTAFIGDTSFDVEGSAQDELAKAVGRVVDAAVLFGTNAPPTFPVGGVVAGTAITGTDALDAIDKGAAAVEAAGLMPDGVASGPQIGSALRKAYREAGALPGDQPEPSVYGMRIAVTPLWDSTKSDAVVGAWENLLVGIREDIRFDVSEEGVLVDDAGVIQVSAFQDDMTLVRIYMRLGVVIGTPVKADGSGPADAFVTVDWTP